MSFSFLILVLRQLLMHHPCRIIFSTNIGGRSVQSSKAINKTYFKWPSKKVTPLLLPSYPYIIFSINIGFPLKEKVINHQQQLRQYLFQLTFKESDFLTSSTLSSTSFWCFLSNSLILSAHFIFSWMETNKLSDVVNLNIHRNCQISNIWVTQQNAED